MKFCTLLPLLIHFVLAIPASEVYRSHLGQGYPIHLRHSRHHSLALGTPKVPCNMETTTSSVALIPNKYRGNSTSYLSSSTAPAETTPTSTITNSPQSTTTSSKTLETSSSTGGGSTQPSDIQAYLDAHNTLRANHNAAALTWSDMLATAAQTWADKCVFNHSDGSLGPYGENLAAGSDLGIGSAIQLWSNEASQYDPSNPVPSHYTQMVWKSTTQLGCAVANCEYMAIFGGPAKFYVCEYSPPGNVIGEFAQNVQ